MDIIGVMNVEKVMELILLKVLNGDFMVLKIPK